MYSEIINRLVIRGSGVAADAWTPQSFTALGPDLVASIATLDVNGTMNPYYNQQFLWGVMVQLNMSSFTLANMPINVAYSLNTPGLLDTSYDGSGSIVPSTNTPSFLILMMKTIRQFIQNAQGLSVPNNQTTNSWQPTPFITSTVANSAFTITLPTQAGTSVTGSVTPFFVHDNAGEVAANVFSSTCAVTTN